MKKLAIYSLSLLFAGFLFSCSDDEEQTIVPINEQQAASKALTMTSGTVISTDPDTTSAGAIYYDVEVRTSAGAIIEFEYFQADGSLKSIEGDSGPFDYEVNPGMGLMLYSAARTKALNTHAGAITGWDLVKGSSGIWTYTFEIETDSNSFTVKINAQTGEIISS